ncbi:MAG: hypothetical protein ACRDLO_03920 [Solirubrobacterales bacterium]
MVLALPAIIALVGDAGIASAKGAPRAFYGVVPHAKIDDRDLRRMKAGRLGTVRITLPWTEIDRSGLPDAYDWSKFDVVVAGASRQRITVLPTVYSVPLWLARLEGCERADWVCAITPPRSEFGLGEWRAFLGAAVQRYGPGGDFWALHPEIPPRPIRAWQIWNEPNSLGFYQPRPDVARYAELLTVAAEAIRGGDPGAEVLLGGLWHYPMAERQGGIQGSAFLEQLYGVPGIEAAFDGIAIHPYAARMAGVKAQVRQMVGIARAAGDEEVGTWITEVGWASGGRDHPLNRGPAGQARRLEQRSDGSPPSAAGSTCGWSPGTPGATSLGATCATNGGPAQGSFAPSGWIRSRPGRAWSASPTGAELPPGRALVGRSELRELARVRQPGVRGPGGHHLQLPDPGQLDPLKLADRRPASRPQDLAGSHRLRIERLRGEDHGAEPELGGVDLLRRLAQIGDQCALIAVAGVVVAPERHRGRIRVPSAHALRRRSGGLLVAAARDGNDRDDRRQQHGGPDRDRDPAARRGFAGLHAADATERVVRPAPGGCRGAVQVDR